VVLNSKNLVLLFVFREGAIDRLVNIYKNVVHKTGVRFFFSFFFKKIWVFATKVGLFFNCVF